MVNAETAPKLAGLAVLVVDDDIDMARLIDALLRDMGISEVDRAKDGAQALVKLRRNLGKYHLIISDWEMPEIDGLELLREIRSWNIDLPFLMLTVRSSAEEILAAKQAQVTAYVSKPFTPIDLQKKILGIFCQTAAKDQEPETEDENADVFLIC